MKDNNNQSDYQLAVAKLGKHAKTLVEGYSTKNNFDLEDCDQRVKEFKQHGRLKELILILYGEADLTIVLVSWLMFSFLFFGIAMLAGLEDASDELQNASVPASLLAGISISAIFAFFGRGWQKRKDAYKDAQICVCAFSDLASDLAKYLDNDKTPLQSIQDRLSKLALEITEIENGLLMDHWSVNSGANTLRKEVRLIAELAAMFNIIDGDITSYHTEAQKKWKLLASQGLVLTDYAI